MCPSAAAERERKRRKKNGAVGEVGTMDPLLWGRLPEDLVDKLVQYLPVPALLRARAVCRRLRDFVFSDKFQEARACVPAWSYLSNKETPYLLVFVTIEGHRLCSAYDAVADVWRRMPPMPGLPSRAKDCVAGDGGLLCFRDVDEQGQATLFVYNPLMQHHRELPPMQVGNSMIQHEWILTHMVMDRFTGAYKIMVLTKKHGLRKGAHMEVYDSHKQTWTVDIGLSALERRYNLSFSPQVGACCDNFFYFVAREGICGTNIMGLVVYDIFEGCWREKLLYRCEPRCPGSKIEVQVVECKGTVYMVVREDDCAGTKGVSFCRLNPSREQKIEDAVLFESFFSKWGSKFPSYRCVSVRSELGLLLYDKSFQVLVDDLSQELMLPTCPFEGLENCVSSTLITRSECPQLQMLKRNLISEVHYQPNPAACV
jgi:hypothetical protein